MVQRLSSLLYRQKVLRLRPNGTPYIIIIYEYIFGIFIWCVIICFCHKIINKRPSLPVARVTSPVLKHRLEQRSFFHIVLLCSSLPLIFLTGLLFFFYLLSHFTSHLFVSLIKQYNLQGCVGDTNQISSNVEIRLECATSGMWWQAWIITSLKS